MKKLLMLFAVLALAFSLTSCKVNWLGEVVEVPWYFVVIPVAVLFVAVYAAIISKTYVCPKCKTEFKPKWYQLSICIHLDDGRVAKCPKCSYKGFCKIKKSK